MDYEVADTIAAIATATGSALRGVVRISGPETFEVLGRVSESGSEDLLADLTARSISTRLRIEPAISITADVLVWPTSSSFTRQPSAEIHCVGSMALLQMVLDSLVEAGCRLAEPGEFTMRAFLSGRLDLTQAEAVLGIIDSRNERQFDTALKQLAGGIRGPVSQVRDQIIGLLAELEAGLDFVEEDIEFVSQEEVLGTLRSAESEIESALSQLKNRQLSHDRIKVVFAGRPNAGKSSLFNALNQNTQNSATAPAIVSNVAGTTRDYLTLDLSLDGTDIQLIDTAGVEQFNGENESDSESEADTGLNKTLDQKMTKQSEFRFHDADIILLCLESGSELAEVDQQVLKLGGDRVISVSTKCDVAPHTPTTPHPTVPTSALNGTGLPELREAIRLKAVEQNQSDQHVLGTLSRTSESLASALQLIRSGIASTEAAMGEEVVAADLRSALNSLGRVVGAVYTDDILDVVFSQFCIGK